jgi:hypothetical protein
MRKRNALVATVVVLMFTPGVRADLFCAEPVVTLGQVKAGRPLSYRFTFTNRSPNDLQITNVEPSCGCLKPRIGQKRLQPGETGVLVLEVNTLTAPPGPNAWRVQITYHSGGETHDLTLALRATVVAEITVHPAALVLQTETTVGHEITLTDGRPTPIAVTALSCSQSSLRAVVQESHFGADHKKVMTVRINVEPDFPDGRHDETLQIFTSDPEYPELRVPVTVVKHSRSAVRASPAEVMFQGTGGPLPAQIVRLRGVDQLEVEVKKVESDDPSVSCSFAKGPGNMATLRIRVDQSRLPVSGLQTALHVHFVQPNAEVLTIPVGCLMK